MQLYVFTDQVIYVIIDKSKTWQTEIIQYKNKIYTVSCEHYISNNNEWITI